MGPAAARHEIIARRSCPIVEILASMAFVHFLIGACMLTSGTLAQDPEEGYSREQLQPLTQFRQQHRRTIDGRLCAAAFVQNRQAYTGCTSDRNPVGESGRMWCYVEPQLLAGGSSSWNYCAAVVDYDVLRQEASHGLGIKLEKVQVWVSKLQNAQRAAES